VVIVVPNDEVLLTVVAVGGVVGGVVVLVVAVVVSTVVTVEIVEVGALVIMVLEVLLWLTVVVVIVEVGAGVVVEEVVVLVVLVVVRTCFSGLTTMSMIARKRTRLRAPTTRGPVVTQKWPICCMVGDGAFVAVRAVALVEGTLISES